ncbi:MAG: LysR family transcriptional regulator [Alphaproteobacteria bacterium]|nr:LysR family transcriptional regulator [Alphaproteobacteria bacterium]
MRDLPIELLRTLAAVADARSVTGAARALNLSQPAVTQQVKRLERLVDATILRRDGRAVDLTEDGRLLLAYARRILGLNDEAVARLARPKQGGGLRFGLPNDFADNLLESVLGRFGTAHPEVDLEVVCEISITLLAELRAGRLDLVLAMSEDATAEGAAHVWREPLEWVGAQSFAGANCGDVPLVAYPAGCVYRQRMLQSLERAGLRGRVVYTSASLAGLLAAVRSGIGVTVLSCRTAPAGLRVLDQVPGLPTVGSAEIGLHLRPRRPSRASLLLAEFLVEALDRGRSAAA